MAIENRGLRRNESLVQGGIWVKTEEEEILTGLHNQETAINTIK